VLDIHREYLMNHAIDPTKKAYFDESHEGRQEILRAYQEAYPYLSIKTPSKSLQVLEKELGERELEIKEMRQRVEELEGLVTTYKSRVNGFGDREHHIQKMVERMERVYRQILERDARSENPEIRYHAERELKELEEEKES